MLTFRSANVRAVNPQRAVLEALSIAHGESSRCDVVLINAAVGHDLVALSKVAQAECPGARVLAASCAGVVGREGPGESMHDIAVMTIRGEGLTVAHTDGLFGSNSFEKGVELARRLQSSPKPVRMIYLLASGIDIANDRDRKSTRLNSSHRT